MSDRRLSGCDFSRIRASLKPISEASVAMTEMIIATVGLEAGYGGPPVVRGVDISIAKASMTTFVGPNGAGKSTLLRALYGSAEIYAGSIMFGTTGKIEHLSPLDRFEMGIAFVPQGRCNFGQMSVAENLAIAAHKLSSADRLVAAERVLGMFPALRTRQRTLAGNLSGGEQQMLEMAMVLQNEPACLLVDEPSLGLSPKMQDEIFSKLADLRDAGTTIIAVEQNVRGALAISDFAAVLVQGQIAAHGTATEINDNERFRKAYLGG